MRKSMRHGAVMNIIRLRGGIFSACSVSRALSFFSRLCKFWRFIGVLQQHDKLLVVLCFRLLNYWANNQQSSNCLQVIWHKHRKILLHKLWRQNTDPLYVLVLSEMPNLKSPGSDYCVDHSKHQRTSFFGAKTWMLNVPNFSHKQTQQWVCFFFLPSLRVLGSSCECRRSSHKAGSCQLKQVHQFLIVGPLTDSKVCVVVCTE